MDKIWFLLFVRKFNDFEYFSLIIITLITITIIVSEDSRNVRETMKNLDRFQ